MKLFKPLNLFMVEVNFNTDPSELSVHGQKPGVPNDGFFLNTLKTLFRLSRVLYRYLDMDSNWRCKICICSVILGELKSFRNYKGFSIIFTKIFDAYGGHIELIRSHSFLHHIFESEMFRFPISTKLSLT